MHTYLRLGLGLLGILPAAFAAAPVVQRSDAIGILLGQSISYRFIALGDVTSYSAQSLPSGVAIDQATGRITGTPADVGRFPVVVTATNADGSSSATVSINVVSPDAGPLIYAPLTFDVYAQPNPGGDQFTCAVKATGSPTRYTATAALPTGWTFSAGTLTGPTDSPGLFMVPVSATNANGIGSTALTVRVHPACTQAAQTTGNLKAGEAYRVTLQFNRAVSFGGEAPYLQFYIYPSGALRRVPYVSGNGSSTFVFEYTVAFTDPAGDIQLSGGILPESWGGVTGVADSDGLDLGASLPRTGSTVPAASIVVAPPSGASGGAVAGSAGGAATPSTTASASTGTPSTSPTASTGTAVTSSSTATPSTSSTGPQPNPATTLTATPPSSVANSTSTSSSSPTSFSMTTGDVTPKPSVADTTLTPTGNAATVQPAVATTSASAGAPAARLVNLSSRATVAADDTARTFIAGFVVPGTAPKRMLLRAVGPTLATFGVNDAVQNAELRLFDSAGNLVTQNDGWSGAEVASAASATGAFALGAGSHDSATVVSLPPGSYSVQVTTTAGAGAALAEIYDADASATGQPLSNISTRAFVGAGDTSLTAGFVINGAAPKRVLVRGVGPALVAYGVSGVLSDPKLTVYQNGVIVAQNDNWETAQTVNATAPAASGADIAAVSSAVGAFQLTSGSRDAALVVSLVPGAYTAVVSAADGGTGVALVEVYQVP